MAIADDISVAVNGDIRYTGTTATYTVLELHRFLQDLADNASSSGDDLHDVTDPTSSDRSTDNIITLLNGYNIDDTLAESLYDGSITQDSGNVQYSGLRVLGAVNDTATELQIVQNNALLTAFWGDQSTGGLNGDAAQGILMRCLIKSGTAGADIDGKRIRVQARHWGDSYDFFNVTLGQGESVAAISTTPDAQNDTLQATVTAYTHVTNTEGFQLIDLNNGNGNQEYYSQWTYGADTSGNGLKGVWEFTKDLTGTGTAKTIHSINGELFLGITHSFAYDNELVAQFQEDETLSWGTGVTAGTGLLLALDDDGVTGNMYMQLLTGVAPTDGLEITGGTSTATCDVDGSVTSRTIPKHFLGSYTGTLIGAYGIGVLPNDLTASDALKDLANADQIPPNNVTFAVSSLIAGEDRILVGPEAGGILDLDQLILNTSLTAADESSIVCTASIPTDTPTTGTIRVQTDAGIYKMVRYSSYTSATFTIIPDDTFGDGDVTVGTDSLTLTAHEFLTGDHLQLTTTGTLPAGLALATDYWVIYTDANTIQLAASEDDAWAGTPVTITAAAGGGTHTTEYQGRTWSSDNATNPRNIFVSYIDKLAEAASESFTGIYKGSDTALFIRVRDGAGTPIKTFETPSSLTSSGGSVSAIRTSDA
jgi:hypothetical protein